VQSNAQVRQSPRSLDGVGCSRARNHQARGAEDAAAVRFFDGGVDRLAQSEIVRRNDQAIQCASSRRSALPSNAPKRVGRTRPRIMIGSSPVLRPTYHLLRSTYH
jgi:hypothetical protein